MITRDLIDYIVSRNDDAGLIDELQDMFAQQERFFYVDMAEAIDSALLSRIEKCSQPLTNWVSSFATSQRPLPRFLYARLLVRQGLFSEAIVVLRNLADSLGGNAEPSLFLHIVRLLVRTKQFRLAADYLKRALSLNPNYSFMVKSEQLLRKILASGEWQSRRKMRIALLASSTTTFLAPVLQASCFRMGIHAEIYEGGFGNYRQEILDTASTLYTFKPDAVILLLNHRDLALTPLVRPDIAQLRAEELRRLWEILQAQNPCHIVQVGFDIPPYGSWGNLEETHPDGRARIVGMVNSILSESLPPGVSYCDINRIVARLGERFHSDIAWYSSKQYPAPDALPLLADFIASHLRAAFGYSAKVLVLDLDNTLWGGVIGEDGLGGIVVGPPSPEGEGYLDLQRYAKELKDRGVLLAVCSKNNLEDAELPFKEHDAMILRLDDFVLFTANWEDKASNIQDISQRLALGLDSFVFLDDNPLERAWVRSRLPEVTVPECGSKPWEMLAALRSGMWFESIAFTPEDAERHKSYKSNLVRQELEKTASTVEEFLTGLEMIAECGPIDNTVLARVTQLINKTNQFNLTTRRYTEEQVKRMAESPDWWTSWFRLKDKFGDHGLIGVILAKKGDQRWTVDTWLMSCRVLGRKMEGFMFSELVSAARRTGARTVVGEYVPTAKNALVKDMYTTLGFVKSKGENEFTYSLTEACSPLCHFIRTPDQLAHTQNNRSFQEA